MQSRLQHSPTSSRRPSLTPHKPTLKLPLILMPFHSEQLEGLRAELPWTALSDSSCCQVFMHQWTIHTIWWEILWRVTQHMCHPASVQIGHKNIPMLCDTGAASVHANGLTLVNKQHWNHGTTNIVRIPGRNWDLKKKKKNSIIAIYWRFFLLFFFSCNK